MKVGGDEEPLCIERLPVFVPASPPLLLWLDKALAKFRASEINDCFVDRTSHFHCEVPHLA